MTSARAWWSWLIVAFGLLLPAPALAQVDVKLELSAREVAVGEGFQVQLEAMSSSDEVPSEPELVVPPSFELRGPSTGTKKQISLNGFNMQSQSGISATWLVTPTRPGVYSIGPGSVLAEGRRQQAAAIQIRVLPEGQKPRRARPRRRPFDPFGQGPFGRDPLDDDPFGRGPLDDLFDQLRGGGRFDQLPEAPPEIVPERSPDARAFLRGLLDLPRAYVGQQVTLSIYAHGSQGMFQEVPGGREPSHPDFLAQRLVEDSSRQPRFQYVRDGQSWVVAKVRETALFPLRAGRLEIGPLEITLAGRGYGSRGSAGLRRTSNPLSIEVVEPPLAGRPPGFAGEVGHFQLSAVVEPRTVTEGGSIAITARVDGTGRMPSALVRPEQSGVEWLEPTLRDETTTTGTTLGGSRTFSYVLRITRAGDIDLGTLSLPYFDPADASYHVAMRELGVVHVEPKPELPAAAAAPAEPAPSAPKLSEWARFRPQLERRAPASFWTDAAGFWILLLFGPALVVLAFVLRRLKQRLASSLSQRDRSLANHATRALVAARRALAATELRDVASASERAVYAAVEWATGLKVRAFMRSELAPALTAAGLPRDLSEQSVNILGRCAELRVGAAQPAAAGQLVADVEALVKRLVQRPAAAPRAGAAAATLLLLLLVPALARAEPAPRAPEPTAERLAQLQAALARGSYSEVVDQLELWSDQGVVAADLSFNRGVAYLGRAESSEARRADLGQAAAGFEEASHLNPADDEARHVLSAIRERIAERRAKANAGVVARPRLTRALIGLLDENVWAALAVLGSIITTLGLGLRLFSASSRVQLGGSIAAAAGAFVLLLGGAMAYGARQLRLGFSPAVVIVEEARLLDERGQPFTAGRDGPSAQGGAGDRVPEGFLVHIAETRGPLARVEWGDSEAWVAMRELRPLAKMH